MQLLIISFKQCWQENGKWYSSGGFPLQMNAITSIFHHSKLLITQVPPRDGGIPFNENIQIYAMRSPIGRDFRRKIELLLNIIYYLKIMVPLTKSSDVIHTPLPGDLSLIGMLLALIFKKRLIARYGGAWERNNRNTFMNDINRTIMRKFAGGRNVMLIAGSGNVPPHKNMHWLFSTAVSKNELIKYHPDLTRGLSSPPLFAFLGRLSPEKGVDTLLLAIHLLKDRDINPMPKILIIGDGPEKEDLKKLANSLLINEWVSFIGMVNREKLVDYLLKVDLCVQATLTESLSKAWLDAFAFGLPVIAGDIGSSRETIGVNNERGWIVEPGNAHALADSIHNILTSKINWPEIRQQCRSYAENRTLEDWAEKINLICTTQWNLKDLKEQSI